MSEEIPEARHWNFIQAWQEKNQENIEKWGWQDAEVLLLSMQEELGELTQSVLEYRYEDGGYQEMYDELADLAALMFAMHHTIEQGIETSDEMGEMDDQTKEDLIVTLLRAKRKVKGYDLDLTAEMNRLQRELEEDINTTGVELAPEYGD